MLYDGISLAEGTAASNFTIASGTSNPATPTTGELFYRTDSPNEGLYVYTGTEWQAVGSGNVSFDSLNVKPAVRAATTANITLSGTQTIDGVSVIAGDRVLVKNQNTGSQNGIYVVASGSWTRSTDFDGSPSTEVKAGDFVFVTEGTTNADTAWVLATNGTITIGTTALTFSQFSSGSSALTSTYIGYGSGSNLLTGTSTFTWDNSTRTLTVGTGTGTTTVAPGPGTYGDLVVRGSTSTGSVRGGDLYLQAGTAQQFGGINTGASVFIRGGLGGGDTGIHYGGPIVFQTQNGGSATTYAERMRMLHTGALSFGTSGTAYGTSGQVLTSNGDAPPSWQNAPLASAAGSNTQVQFNSSGSLGASSNLVWNNTNVGLGIGQAPPATAVKLNVYNSVASPQAIASNPIVRIASAGSTTDAHILLTEGINAVRIGHYTGFLYFTTNDNVERLRITSGGAWGLGGANYGTSGQVLTSNGSGSAPSWQDAAGGSFTGGTVANAITITSAAPQLTLGSTTNTTGRVVSATTSAGAGGTLQIVGASATVSGQAGGTAQLLGGAGSGTGGGGEATVQAGNTSGTTGAAVNITGGGNNASGSGGDVIITSGISTSGSGGALLFRTGGASFVITERLRILANGAWSVGTGGTATGTSGQVLTSNGSGSAPTWQNAAAGALTSTYIGYGSGSNLLTGSASFTWDNANSTLTFGSTNPIITGGATSTTRGTVTLRGTNCPHGNDISIIAGSANGVGVSTNGGKIAITSGSGSGSYGAGDISLTTGAVNSLTSTGYSAAIVFSTNNAERFRILANGAWQVGNGSTGTSGQVLTSNGSGSAPTWQAASSSFTKYDEFQGAITASATTNIDCSLANNFTVTMSANITTLTFSNIPASGRNYSVTLYVTQDATGGREIVWPAAVKWPNGTAPSLSTGANKIDVITLVTYNAGTSWLGFVSAQNM